MSNQTKVLNTNTGPLQGDKALSRDPKSALFEILEGVKKKSVQLCCFVASKLSTLE